jgi:glycosyltransferase involved in cell wall biosynthesis
MVFRRPLTVVQLLPALEGGGVERGTLEVAHHLVEQGHRAIVISAGGRLVKPLIESGAEHVSWSVGAKHPGTLRWFWPLRRLLRDTRADILHVRSRVPAWLAWLVWRGMSSDHRPRFVTTLHGLHSVGWHSAIMTWGERVIAVSETVRHHIETHYPAAAERVTVIHRGIDRTAFPPGYRPSPAWLAAWHHQYPQLQNRPLLTLPGRLTRRKGHAGFIELIRRLNATGCDVYGLIVGGEDPRRQTYARELAVLAAQTKGKILFTGHRNDMREIYAISNGVVSLSEKPESFGRTVLEAASLGVPVLGFDHGGVGEVLRHIYPKGLIPLQDRNTLEARARALLVHPETVPSFAAFDLQDMLESTMRIYQELA